MADNQYGNAEQGRDAAYDNFGYRAELANRLHRDWPNGQKSVYVSRENQYDSWDNIPGEENEGSNRQNCKRCFLLIGIILLIIGIIAGIVLAIYFSQRDAYKPDVEVTVATTPAPSTIPVPQPVTKKFDVSLVTSGNFTPALNDSSSPEYKAKEAEVKRQMDDAYKNSSMASQYNRTDVKGFRPGSIIIDIRIIFIIIIQPATPTPSARNMTSPPPSDNTTSLTTKTTTTSSPDIFNTINEQFIRNVIQQNAEKINLLPNNVIIVVEITTTPQPTTTPLTTTTITVPVSTSHLPTSVPTESRSAPTTVVRETVTESIRPQTDLPPTEQSKTFTASTHRFTSESQSPITEFPTTKELAPESTTQSELFTTDTDSQTIPLSATTPFIPVDQTGQTTIGTQTESMPPTITEMTTQTVTTAPNRTTGMTTPANTTAFLNRTSTYTVTTTTPIYTTTQFANVSDECNPELASCKNGQCIRQEWFCDNHTDCMDASDEDDARCERNTTKPPVEPQKSTGNELDCNFETPSKELCNYKTSPGTFNWFLARGSTTSKKTGPDFDHTFMNTNGQFLFTESSYGNYNDKAKLTSVEVTTDNTSHSFTFFYHMYGAQMGSLEVYFNIFTENGVQKLLKWRESGNHGNIWLKACIEMPKEVNLSVEFVAYRGFNYTSDIAIDDIKYSTDICTSVFCTYEDSDCGHLMLNGENTTSDSYEWQRMRGEDMVNKAWAPKTDFTQGNQYGAFLMADSKIGNPGKKATFHTPIIRTSKSITLNFQLYMSGENLGNLRLNLLSKPDMASNLTYQRSSATNGWQRVCIVIPKYFVGIAEFVATHGVGPSGYIAVDDVALGPESTCDGFSVCRFESGIFCKFDVIGKDYRYRWHRYNSLNGHYLIASGEGPEGSTSTLVSPIFLPLPNSSVRLRYAIEGTSILSVWVTKYINGDGIKNKIWTTEGLEYGVQTVPIITGNFNSIRSYQVKTNPNNLMDWMTACFQLPTANNVSIEIVSRKIDRQGGKVALDWVMVNTTKCEIGLQYRTCNFDEPHLCDYKIECPISTQYKWKRISGSTPTTSTGPLRDHTYNNTIGHYLYTEGSVGRPGDKTFVIFMNVQSAEHTSFRFYYYMSGRDIGELYITFGGQFGKKIWIQKGDKSPYWYLGCIDLPSNNKTNVSIVGVHGKGPLSDIAIDDVHIYQERCPVSQISCDFENEMMCGYTGLSIREMRSNKSFKEQWKRLNRTSSLLPPADHTFNTSKGHFLATMYPAKIMSPRFAYGQTMCLQFYYFIQLGKGQNISVAIDYEDRRKNTVKLFGTNGFSLAHWRHGQMTLVPGNLSVIFSVNRYSQEISNTIFAIDDVKIDYGQCSNKVCSTGMFKCPTDDICIPNYKKCDWVKDCSDGFDEQNCPANRAKIRLVDGVVSGGHGRLEIYANGSWGTVYSLRWFESNAKVACRQLGYTGYSKSMRFGKFFFGLGNVWQIKCIGNETSLQDCQKINVVHAIPHLYDVGLACYNTVCEPGKDACPSVPGSSIIYCLNPSQLCDGDFDCPGGEDERNCSNCSVNEFTCQNHKCIPNTNRCDGKPDCPDASDEMNCIRRDMENYVEIYYNHTWTALCSGDYSEALYSSLCLFMGQGVAKRKTVGASTEPGLIPYPNLSKMSVIGKYELSRSSSSCPKLELECYGQECGSRAEKMSDPFVQFGSQAIPAEYPWQAVLLRNGYIYCGASIFNSRWLITAAHCVGDRYVKYEVVVGLFRMQDLDKYPKIKVIDTISSMNFNRKKGIPINDIALILLEKDLVFSRYIQPVCLPSKLYTSQDYCYLSGFGRDENLISQSHLKETKVYPISSDECKKYYDNVTDNSFICFSHNKPNMPSCYGDSGGPLVCRNDRGRFELVGIVSFGAALCAAPNGTPAAFTNVLNFRGWIVDQTRCKMWCPNGRCLYEAETCDGIEHCTDRSDELSPKCNPTIACNFGNPYKCGYKNASSNPWYWTSPYWPTPFMKSKPMIGGDTETDEYMLASLNATSSSPAKLVSSETTEIACVSFKYLTNANNSAQTVLSLKAKTKGSSTYNEVWNNGINNTQVQLFWKLATVSLPIMTTSIMFEASYKNPNGYSFIAIDSIKVMDKNCTVCLPNEFQCNNGHCIDAIYVCDRIQHCPNNSDELNCFKPKPPVGCNNDQFTCSNGQCILKDKKCNAIKDCRDGSDEINCTKATGSM